MNNDKGQGLLSKYVWVIETIYRRKRLSFKDLNDLWLQDDISRGVELPKRTFDNWKNEIWDVFGINIVNERRGRYRYYIENEEDINSGGVLSWLYNTASVVNTLSNCHNIRERILLENVPSGQEYLQTIVEAMKNNRVLNITYQSYWSDDESNFDVEPFCVKLFRQRWYLVARSIYYNDKPPMVYSLDRISQLQMLKETFDMPKDWNAEEFFDGCFGVFRTMGTERVKIKVTATQANYIRSLQLHNSQREVERNEDYSIFTYSLRPEYDFQQELLRHGEDVEVLEPQWLREEIAGKIQRMNSVYKSKIE